ncbi:uncharacterized protein HMPREF1541_06562 [Cyphellophora europaea CBS 101466]|uniref:Uncharacterized protein n=1 Tax=Cyphellophora europaea (strain CBS 101466) TaxID=1220924 RepID=W2RPY2_CYPE1|nr:uncharacterized protein HMPREF1541_06562 [Cyphellophora europaea CBS 101466]ETN38527.1 hypothetical protein HMPREF1541_06562 [Cyphellophora europaea CBS 101466]
MGGNAFRDLETPRMPLHVYLAVRERLQNLLKQHFTYVATPLEAPGKKDHGDIDILLCGPITKFRPATDDSTNIEALNYKTEDIAAIIGAEHSRRIGTLDQWNFAIIWPEEVSDHPATPDQLGNTDASIRYIQVDIHILPTLQSFNWMSFMHAHGDLNMIITLTCRPKCLQISEKGFFVGIPELFKTHPKLGRVLATSDPDQVLRFLDLETERFWQHFASWDDLMDFAATCRFHNPAFISNRRDDNSEPTSSGVATPVSESKGSVSLTMPNVTALVRNMAAVVFDQIGRMLPASKIQATAPEINALTNTSSGINSSGTTSAENSAPTDALNLKPSDRKRLKTRPMYDHWISVYLPTHIDDPPRASAHLTKADVIAEAKDFFGPDFAARYDAQRISALKTTGEQKLWEALRKHIQSEANESSEVTVAMKGIKRELIGDDDMEDQAATQARAAFKELQFEDVLNWAKAEWKAVEARQRAYDKTKAETL